MCLAAVQRANGLAASIVCVKLLYLTTALMKVVLGMLQGLNTCGLRENPAKDVMTRLTLLSLRDNHLAVVADALPNAAVRNLRVLDISGNVWGQPPKAHKTLWTAENLAAFSNNQWASLRVLGIRPWLSQGSHHLTVTAYVLERVLQEQAAAALPPRPSPVVVYSDLNAELLQPSDRLAVVA
jgi:hypothetical protein